MTDKLPDFSSEDPPDPEGDVKADVERAKEASRKVRVIRYLHGEDDELSDLWEPDAPQQKNYHYALYEVAVELEVDLDTGKSRVVAVDGRPVLS